MKKWNWSFKEIMIDLLFCTLGSAIFAFATYYFTAPHHVAPGGVTGLSTVFNYLTGFPIGVYGVILNTPLIILGLIYLGKKFVIRSAYCIGMFSVFHDFVFASLPVFESENTLLAAIFGGLLIGGGLGLVFMRDSSTGGTDIAARLLQLKWPHLSLGRLMLGIDFLIVITCIIAYGSIEAGLYSLVCIFTCSKTVDMILYGQDVSKQVMIVTDHPEACAKALTEELDRGLTLFHGEGGYTGNPKKIVVCVARRSEYHAVRQLVKRIDPKAFLIISEVSEVWGEGFKSNQ